MAGIYVHIPFCRQKCHYCNFFSVASQSGQPEVIQAIVQELALRSGETGNEEIMTVYFGGGTPSLLSPMSLSEIMAAIGRHYHLAEDAEITLEANPDDINSEKLASWKNMGFNRLSIGIQSFHDNDLEYLNRVHSAEKATESLHLAKSAGFNDLTIDLIFGIPTLSDDGLLDNISKAVAFGVQHVSAYALTVEPNTALDVMIRKHKIAQVDEQASARQFLIMAEQLQRHGYLHYEISNYCLPGKFARHNTAYWQGVPYLGVGPSAHSYNGTIRKWNVSGIVPYINAIKNKDFPADSETLTPSQQYNEYVMTGLRTMWGCNVREIELRFGPSVRSYFQRRAEKWIRQLQMLCNGDIYSLSPGGQLFADGIAADLFIPDTTVKM